jgi:hypothetical protein
LHLLGQSLWKPHPLGLLGLLLLGHQLVQLRLKQRLLGQLVQSRLKPHLLGQLDQLRLRPRLLGQSVQLRLKLHLLGLLGLLNLLVQLRLKPRLLHLLGLLRLSHPLGPLVLVNLVGLELRSQLYCWSR